MRKRTQPPIAPMLPFYDPAEGKFSRRTPSRVQTLAQLARQDLDRRSLAGRHLFAPEAFGLEPLVAVRAGRWPCSAFGRRWARRSVARRGKAVVRKPG